VLSQANTFAGLIRCLLPLLIYVVLGVLRFTAEACIVRSTLPNKCHPHKSIGNSLVSTAQHHYMTALRPSTTGQISNSLL
jgi:hypothetical protein